MSLIRLVIAIALVGLTFLAAFISFWRFYFLRLPKRTVPKGNVIVSPANGRIVSIIQIKGGNPKEVELDKGLLGRIALRVKDTIQDGFLISIMLTPFDVHYQRSPLDGKVINVKYTKGAFRNAVWGAASFRAIDNERNEIMIEVKQGKKIKVVQIAGVAARRITCFVKKGQMVKKGEVIGLINLGSQVSLVIPKRKLFVKMGQKVIDGETVLAK